MADGFEMRCVYMMTDENITANADKKILFGIMRQNMYMTEKKVYIEGAGQALFRDKTTYFIKDSI